MLERILAVDYQFPPSIPVSRECKDLLSKILVADPSKRYTISDIQKHPWCHPDSVLMPLHGHTPWHEKEAWNFGFEGRRLAGAL